MNERLSKPNLEKIAKDQRHQDNLRIADKVYWRGQYFEGGIGRPRKPVELKPGVAVVVRKK